MKRTLVAFSVFALFATRLTVHAQQIPHLSQLLLRGEQFNRLYNEKRRAGANLASVDQLRQQAETTFKTGNVASMIEIISHGIGVLEGKTWDERQRFLASL